MALSATVNKVSLNIADMNRHYYQQHQLTVAQHPSENDFRFMVRIFAFALNADSELQFTKGLSAEDEPEVWKKSLSDEIQLWIDFGQVDEKRIRKACGRARRVRLYTYNQRKADVWWQQHESKLDRYRNLELFHLHAEGAEMFAGRKTDLQCTIQDDELLVTDGGNSLVVRVEQRTGL